MMEGTRLQIGRQDRLAMVQKGEDKRPRKFSKGGEKEKETYSRNPGKQYG